MTFFEVCSLLTLLLSFVISISAFSISRAKHSRSSTRVIHSLVFVSVSFVTSSNSFFKTPTCLLQDYRWFPAYSSSNLAINWSLNFWLASFNCQSSSSRQTPAVSSISLLSILFRWSPILWCISFKFWTLISALFTILSGCSCVKGTTYLFFEVSPIIQYTWCLNTDLILNNSGR